MTIEEGKTAPEGGTDDVRAIVDEITEEMQPEIDAMRDAVAQWNEGVQAYRDKAGADAALPAEAFKYHPGYPGIRTLLGGYFHWAPPDELDSRAARFCATIGRDDDGNITFNGGDADKMQVAIDSARYAANLAMRSGDPAMTMSHGCNADFLETLSLLLWGELVATAPLAIAFREASA